MNPALACTFDGPDRVIVATNPRAGAGGASWKIHELAATLGSHGLRVDILTDLDQVTRTAEQAHQAGTLRALVAAGGDGTVAELVNRTSPGLPISVFPLGTANLLAGYLRIGQHIGHFSRMISEGSTLRLDAGRAGQRVFLLMVGVGFDAEVVERLHQGRQGHISMWSYAKPIFDSIRSYEYPELRIECDGAPLGQPGNNGTLWRARWAFIVNLPCYAAGLQFAPQAVGTDGQLDLCTFRQGSLWQGLRYLGYLWARQHTRLADHSQMQATTFHIEADRPVRYQLDGDPGGLLPLDISILPNRLTLVAPAHRVAELAGLTPEVAHRV